jgi:hypothetical protein
MPKDASPNLEEVAKLSVSTIQQASSMEQVKSKANSSLGGRTVQTLPSVPVINPTLTAKLSTTRQVLMATH